MCRVDRLGDAPPDGLASHYNIRQLHSCSWASLRLFVSNAVILGCRLHKGTGHPILMSELPEGEKELEGRYANYFEVGFNAYEFLIDFGQQYPPSSQTIHTRIVTSPSLARNLLEVLARSLREYARGSGQATRGTVNR